MKIKTAYLFVLLIFLSCKNKENKENIENIENIEVKVSETKEYPQGDFSDYFSSSKLVALETSENSIFHNIDRLSFYKDKIFILDKESDAVFVFNDKGHFLNKIQTIGRGPREYLGLLNFTIDEDKEHIILHSGMPAKLITYTINGLQFVREEKLKTYYDDLGYYNNILFLTKNLEHENMFMEHNLDTKKEINFVKKNIEDKYFYQLGSLDKSIKKSKGLHVALPYTNTVYQYDGEKVFPKYYIDFGASNVPNNIADRFDEQYNGISDYIYDNSFGFGVSSFRENENYITFKFWNAMIVIYSKKSKEAKTFSVFSDDRIPFYNYLAHDGDDNKIVSVYPAVDYKRQMDIYKKGKGVIFAKLPEYIKEMDKNISPNDNPLLIIYTFKE